ncbi:MAG: transcriptional regulator [Candidatus Aenigmatarchaeota archaeon]
MIPLNPVGKKEIEELQNYLFFATLFRKDVLELAKDPEERLTWVDSLFVAAASIARAKARMSLREIATEVGRTEQTIKKHIDGESKAGKLVLETYELLKKGELKNEVELVRLLFSGELPNIIEENKKLKEKIEKIKEILKD